MAHSLFLFKMKVSYFFSVIIALLLFVSCGQPTKTKEDAIADFQESLTAKDSLAMLELTENCMQLLKKGDINQALDLLYMYDESAHTVTILSEQEREVLGKKFSMFPVKDYKLVYYSFQLEGLNDVKYDVAFGMEDAETGALPHTSYMFNPVKLDGEWYLSVKMASQAIDETRR